MTLFVRYILRGLAKRLLVSCVVIGGIAIVSAIAIAVGALQSGMKTIFGRGDASRVVVMSRGVQNEFDSKVPLEAQQAVRSATAAPVMVQSVFSVMLWHELAFEFAVVRGLSPEEWAARRPRLIEGRMPGEGEAELLVGSVLVKRHPELRVGSSFTLLDSPFVIVGIMEGEGITGGELWSTRAAITQQTQQADASVLAVVTASPAEAEALVASLSAQRAHAVLAITDAELLSRISSRYDGFLVALWIIEVLMLVGASASSVSAISSLIMERKGEYAALRAIGFKRRFVALLVLSEVLLLALIGVAIAVPTAIFFASGRVERVGYVYFQSTVSQTTLIAAIGLGMLTSTVGAALPIWRSMKEPIRDALRG